MNNMHFDLRQQRILQVLPAARSMAERVARKLPATVEVDDLAGAARMALIEAADRFDGARGVPFEAYARRRMHGAMLDSLRADDHLSRGERRRQREADRAEASLTSELGRQLSADEQRHARKNEPVAQPHSQVFASLEECETLQDTEGAAGSDALADYLKAESARELRSALEKLSDRERLVLSLCYERDLNYSEIGEVLGVGESRVCQIMRGAYSRLRELLEGEVEAERACG